MYSSTIVEVFLKRVYPSDPMVQKNVLEYNCGAAFKKVYPSDFMVQKNVLEYNCGAVF